MKAKKAPSATHAAVMAVDLKELTPKTIANVIADLIRVSPYGLAPFQDGYEKMLGAEITISDDRTVVVLRQYLVHEDLFRYQVRVWPKSKPGKKR